MRAVTSQITKSIVYFAKLKSGAISKGYLIYAACGLTLGHIGTGGLPTSLFVYKCAPTVVVAEITWISVLKSETGMYSCLRT